MSTSTESPSTENTSTETTTPPAHSRAGTILTVGAVALAALAIALPLLALPAMLLTVIAAAQASGRARVVALAVAGPLVLVASSVFILKYAAAGIIESGRRAAESKAVARLRELHWAQDRARLSDLCDFDGDGVSEYAFLGSLTGQYGPSCEGGTPLRVESFQAVTAASMESDPPSGDSSTRLYRGDGFNYAVYLPRTGGGWSGEGEEVDHADASRRWVAYAWPANTAAGLRSYFIDQDERICETVEERVFAGDVVVPPSAGPVDAMDCVTSTSGIEWRAWKGKKSRRQ